MHTAILSLIESLPRETKLGEKEARPDSQTTDEQVQGRCGVGYSVIHSFNYPAVLRDYSVSGHIMALGIHSEQDKDGLWLRRTHILEQHSPTGTPSEHI